MSKFSASVNSDLGNGSFWVEIGDAEHVDQCTTLAKKIITAEIFMRLISSAIV